METYRNIFFCTVALFHPDFLFCVKIFKPKRSLHLHTISEVTISQHHTPYITEHTKALLLF